MGYTEAIEQQITTLGRVRGLYARYASEDRLALDVVVSALKLGEPFFVVGEIGEVIAAAARSLLPTPLLRDFVPQPYGWLYLQRPVECARDHYGSPVDWKLRAITWADGVNPDGSRVLAIGEFQAHPETGHPDLVATSFWQYGRPGKQEGWDEAERYLYALFAFIRQRVVVAAQCAVRNRAVRKRLGRTLTHEPLVRVIELRRRDYQQRDESHDLPAEWSCQWLVRGHWHCYHTRAGLQPRWVNPYVKGPDDKPFKAPRATVYEVVR